MRTALAAAVLLLSAPVGAAVFVVDSTGDGADAAAGNGVCATAGGVCTLRAAIQEANALAGANSIHFAIGTGPQRIERGLGLPILSSPTVIDATTQPGYAGTPLIEMPVKLFIGSECTVRGFVFTSGGVVVDGTDAVVERNWFGLAADGITARHPNYGVEVLNAQRATIRNNVIAGCDWAGIYIDDANSLTIEGNIIGLAADGETVTPNSFGIWLNSESALSVRIGGSAPSQRNIISGNRVGVRNSGAPPVTLDMRGNWIGITRSGAAAGNTNGGVVLDTNGSATGVIGGGNAGDGNVIANNGEYGIYLGDSLEFRIEGNAIYDNTGLGIDLGGNGVGANDPGDADSGPNHNQNYPVLTSAVTTGTYITLEGTLSSTAGRGYRICTYANRSSDPSAHGEGEFYLGCTTTTTDASGNASFSMTATLPGGATYFTATATDLTEDVTSEFSAAITAAATGQLQFASAASTANEGAGNAVVVVERTGGNGGTVGATIGTASGSAAAGADFTSVTTTVTFANGESGPKNVLIPIANDGISEATESFAVALSNPTGGAAIGAPANATVSITDDDPWPALSIGDVTVSEGDSGATSASFTVTLTGSTEQTVTVQFAAANGTATTPADYTAVSGTLTFAPGTSSQSIVVPVNGDTVLEASEAFQINLASATNATIADGEGTGTIVNDDNAPAVSIGDVTVDEGTSATMTVTLSGASGQTITVDYETVTGSAVSADYVTTSGQLTFAPGDTTKTLVVPTLDDSIDEESETFLINLSAPMNATVGDGQAIVTITDGDPLPSMSIDNPSIVEGSSGSANVHFSVVLSNPSSRPVSISWSTADRTAASGADYTPASPQTLIIPAGVSAASLSVAVLGDGVVETNETFAVILTAPENATIADGDGEATIIDDDGTPSLTVSDATVVEGNSGASTLVFGVTLAPLSSQVVSVGYTTVAGTASAGSDYSTTTGTLLFTAGQPSQTITVPVLTDSLAESVETVMLQLFEAGGAVIVRGLATGTIIDDDGGSPSLTISDATVTESGVSAAFVVSLSAASSSTVSVDYATADVTAKSGSDYTATSGTLIFDPGQVTKDIVVSLLGDALQEPTETLTINLTNAVEASVTRSSATGTIIDDDGGSPSLTISDATVTESAGSAVFVVSLSAASSSMVSVDFATSNGTAVAGSDYGPSSGTLTFTQGQVSKDIAVPLLNDGLLEPAETLTVNLSNAVQASVTRSSATGTIIDDDGAPSLTISDASVIEGDSGTSTLVFSVTLAPLSSQVVSVGYATAAGTASAGSDYTTTTGTLLFTAGQASQTISVPVLTDSLAESVETITLQLSAPAGAAIARGLATGTIIDDDGGSPSLTIGDATVTESAGSAVFVVSLSAASSSTVSVDYATSNGTAVAGSDYTPTSGTLTFNPGQVSKDIAVPLLNDGLQEATETLTVNLSNAMQASVTRGSATATIIDDDGGSPSLTISDATVSESASTAVFVVSLSAASSSTISVDYATSNGTAVSGSDYIPTSGTLTFNPGQVSKDIAVPLLNDGLQEPAETLTVNLSNAVQASVTRGSAIGTIIDDDQPPPAVPSISISDVTVAEGNSGSTRTEFVVTLSTVTSIPVFVNYSTTDGTAMAGSDYTPLAGTVTFAPYMTTQSVAVMVHGDADVELTETFMLVLTASMHGTLLDDRATASIVNDDTPLPPPPPPPAPAPPDLTIDPAVSAEECGDARFTVRLSAPASAQISVTFQTVDGSAAAGLDYEARRAVVVVAPGQTSASIAVPVLCDEFDEVDETFVAALSDAVNATLRAPLAVATIIDDDLMPLPSPAPPDLTIDPAVSAEECGDARFTVRLSAPASAQISVTFQTVDGSAAAGLDYEARQSVVVIPPGQTSASIAVPVLCDESDEVDETFVAALSDAVNATLRAPLAVATIIDDDITPPARRSVGAVAVSAQGAGGVQLRTALRLHNAGTTPISGNVLFHPAGRPASYGDPAILYSLQPGQSRLFPDLAADLQIHGLGTLELVATDGHLPLAMTRVFHDRGPDGTTGFEQQELTLTDALEAGQKGVLFAPASLGALRFDIGVFTLGEGATFEVEVTTASGMILSRIARTVPQNYLEHMSAHEFAGMRLRGDETVLIHVIQGAVFGYGATTDMMSHDSSVQILRRIGR
jgi:CSLREA domain-containing protein